MRLFKLTLAICFVIAITLSAIFYTRSAVVTSVVNNYLTQHNSALTCIDFTLNTNFDLVIQHLCVDSPYAEIELFDSLIEWRFEPHEIDIKNIAEAISAIHIAAVTVRAKGDIPRPENSISSTIKSSEFPTLIRKQFNDIAMLSTPVDIDINTFSYQPFSESKDKTIQSYEGQISANEQQLNFSITNEQKEHIFSFELVREDRNISANVSTNLAQLRSLLKNHQRALPLSLSTPLMDEKWSATGNVTSELSWQNQTLNMKNQVTDFSFDTSQKFALLESVKLGTTFAWQTNLTGETLEVDFMYESKEVKDNDNHQGNNIQLAFNSASLTQLLTAEAVDQQIINLFTDNVIDTLAVIPLGSLEVDFVKKTINSNSVDIISSNLNEPIILSLKDLAVNYRDEAVISVDFQQAKFSLTGQANIAPIQPYSKHPVKLNIIGDIEQHSDAWQLTFTQGTTIELAQLSLPSVDPIGKTTSKTDEKNTETQAEIKSLLSHWQGNVVIGKNDNQDDKNSEGVTFALDIYNQISQLNYPEIIQINAIELTTKLSGSVDNIMLNAEVIADNVPIASAQLTGNLGHPSVTVSAQDLLLTDLLALKIKLPVELKLIDGTIDYRLTSELKNSENLMANSMLFAVSVQELTGEVQGTWLQELNWQQNFTLKNGHVKSINDNTRMTNNLTIAKIETATPISNLATTTAIDFSANTLKLLAHDTHGNLLGGRFDIAKVQWPVNKALPINVKLTKIDLEKLLELDKKQGIVVTGKISGELPIYYDGEYFLIKEGGLKNVGDGIIQVYNNPAVDELKGSNTELKLAFDALENLHYHHLTSEVSMADDGYMLLVTAIKGRNPDLDNEVNLNLNLSYDLLGLLESLNITEHFESKVIKSLQK